MNIEAFLFIGVGIIILVICVAWYEASHIDMVVKRSKVLEGLLRRNLDAKGEGLGDLTYNVKDKLTTETFGQLNQIIGIRNTIVHNESQNRLKDRQKFIELCNNAQSKLSKLKRLKY